MRHLPFFLSGLADFRSLPAIAEKPFRDTFRAIPQKKGKRKAAFYAGCLIDFAHPGMGEDVVKVLNAGGVEVTFPEAQTCCGMGGSYSLKFPEISKPILEKKLASIRDTKAAAAVMDCPGCVMQIRGGFDKREGPVEMQHIARLLARALDREAALGGAKDA